MREAVDHDSGIDGARRSAPKKRGYGPRVDIDAVVGGGRFDDRHAVDIVLRQICSVPPGSAAITTRVNGLRVFYDRT